MSPRNVVRSLIVFTLAMSLSALLLYNKTWTWALLGIEALVYPFLVSKKRSVFLQTVIHIPLIVGFKFVTIFQEFAKIDLFFVNLGCFIMTYLFGIVVPTVLYVIDKIVVADDNQLKQ